MAIEDAYPLTRLQAGMLYHSHLDAAGSTYHDLLSLKVSGALDERRLRRALAALAAGHEMLRTGMDLTGFSEPMQLVHDRAEVPLTVDDLSGLAADERDRRIVRWRADATARPFDLAVPPLLRVHAQILPGGEFWLNLGFHHAILDGWSLSVLTSRLLREYDRALSGGVPEAQRLATRFRDYVLLERKALADDAARGYWRELLDGTEALEVPRWPGHDPAAVAEPRVRVHRVSFGPDLTEKVRVRASSERVAAKSVLFAAHAGVIAWASGRPRVVTGRVANCRPETADAEHMLGLFLNTVPMVLNTRDASWLDLVRQAHRAERDALGHRRYPLSQIQRDLGRDVPFTTMTDYRMMRNYGALELDNLRIVETAFFEQTNFPFTANFGADSQTGEIQLAIGYDTAEFPSAQIEAVGEYYRAALAAIVDRPEAPVTRTVLMSPAETARQLGEWNATSVDFGLDRPLVPRLAEAALRRPNKVALRVGDRTLTYAELHRRAASLARRLRGLGVGPDAVVGVHMRRSPELVVALLGVLGAGGAYLPLDPDYPAERLAFMLADSGARVVLTDSGTPPSGSPETVLTLGPDGDPYDGDPYDAAGHDFEQVTAADHLAYVIYTSGSTGRPKGVQIPHRALVNLLLSMSSEVGLTEDDRWFAVTSLSFDIAGLEVFAPLLAGAELVLVPDGVVHGPELLPLLRDATIAQATPSTWRLLVDAGLGAEPGVRAICGGEALPADLAERLVARMGPVWNAYGPTETTIWSCLRPVRVGEPVTIGGPLHNTRVHVLDDALRLVAVGAPGELYIGGDGLARGYWNRPGLTAGRFVADPFGGPGERLFRTGDTVRRRPDGTLDFIGRTDHQVKIRGFRIETGEIESVLTGHPSVRQAVVVARPDRHGDRQLVAYLVPGGTERADPVELRAHLAAHVPDYMVPAAFVWLEAFPLTPNGKIDRTALPDAARGDTATGEIVEPATATERLVAGLWAEELDLDRVGATDTFRGLGGHSIAALRVVLRIKEATGHDVPLARLLGDGTVRVLAGMIDEGRHEEGSILVPLREGTGTPLFLVHPLGGTVFCYGELADALPAGQPVYGLQAFDLAGPDGPRPDTVEEIAGHYLRAVRAVQPEGPYRFGGWCMGGVVSYEMARQLEAEGEPVTTLALIDSSFADPVPPEWVDDEAAAILGAFADTLPITVEELRRIPAERRLRHALAVAEGHTARPDVGGVDDLRRLVALYRRHAIALLAYRDNTHHAYGGDAVVIRGASAPHDEPHLGWEPQVGGRLMVIETPGDHRTLLARPEVDDLADRLVVAMRDGVAALHRYQNGSSHHHD
ncbi:non-ribosomal peptide synthetase [Actinomadura litoris]|uniref:non-ribosomal peptide synthetase n=1 Tax=Actinomadura litoris TaxID=2678616 RepID=UPI001FA7F45E|nr:amino acid adenylation domain-containing protein [Actinomadura litoris]